MTLVVPPKGTKQPVAPTPSDGAALQYLFVPTNASGGGIPIMANQFIPPNGLAGFMQQTPAVQALYKKKSGGGGGRRRRKKSRRVRL